MPVATPQAFWSASRSSTAEAKAGTRLPTHGGLVVTFLPPGRCLLYQRAGTKQPGAIRHGVDAKAGRNLRRCVTLEETKNNLAQRRRQHLHARSVDCQSEFVLLGPPVN
jgi:hypothetical protein